VHRGFSRLGRINDGRDLLRQLFDARFAENWIGEPSSVLLRREALVEAGGFNVRLSQRLDFELWVRILARYKVGFVDHPLSMYRHHSQSTTARNARSGNDSLDNVWMFETLCELQDSGLPRDEMLRLRRAVILEALGPQARRLLHGRISRDVPAYVRYRLSRRAPRNWAPLEPRETQRAS
jgi:hypothetical protein